MVVVSIHILDALVDAQTRIYGYDCTVGNDALSRHPSQESTDYYCVAETVRIRHVFVVYNGFARFPYVVATGVDEFEEWIAAEGGTDAYDRAVGDGWLSRAI